MKNVTIAALLAVLMLFGTCAYGGTSYDCNNGGRYEDMGDGTVTDCRTGLIWLKNAFCSDPSGGVTPSAGNLFWSNAMKWAAGLGNGICGLNDGSAAGDWRLPTKTEWMAMVEYAKRTPSPAYTDPALTNGAGTAKWTAGDVFTNVQSYYYWSSNTNANLTTEAWIINMNTGYGDYFAKSNDSFVWPVRGGQSASFGSVRIE
jgi:hypothetical protein